jgi:CxxC motif-containing protein (DUF1111 family)
MDRRISVLASVSAIVAAVAFGRVPVSGQDGASPISGVGPDELDRFAAGLDTFTHEHSVDEGLGPFFNGRSCAECHGSPGPGGSSATEQHQVMLFGRSDGAGGFDPLLQLGGPVRSQRRIPGCDMQAEAAPREANVKSHRQPPPLYGLGLIDAVPEEVIVAQVEAGAAADPGEVRGRVNYIGDRIGRFGWKAQAATLEEFVSGSLRNELGITNPGAPQEASSWRGAGACDPLEDPDDDGTRVRALVDFLLLLGPPDRSQDPEAVQHGEYVFHQVGCGACHVPALRTGGSSEAALAERDVPLYSDLLIHDMGEYLADDVVQGAAGSADWRTTPLWGLGKKARYLHDGRTTDLREVIELHSGEGRAARYRLRARPRSDVNALIEFLRSL